MATGEFSVDPRDRRPVTFYVRMSEEPISRTVPVDSPDDPDALIDMDAKGHIVGVEFLTPSFMRKLCDLLEGAMPRSFSKQVRDLCRI